MADRKIGGLTGRATLKEKTKLNQSYLGSVRLFAIRFKKKISQSHAEENEE